MSRYAYQDRYRVADLAQKWAVRSGPFQRLPGLSDSEAVLAAMPGWAQMYVEGLWSLEKFEETADKAIAWALRTREPQPP